jgi:hypothetical protein
VPDGKVAQDCPLYLWVVNEGDHADGVLAYRAAQRGHVPDPRNQVGGGGMGTRGRPVCHISAISAGVRAKGLLDAVPEGCNPGIGADAAGLFVAKCTKSGGRLVSIVSTDTCTKFMWARL